MSFSVWPLCTDDITNDACSRVVIEPQVHALAGAECQHGSYQLSPGGGLDAARQPRPEPEPLRPYLVKCVSAF